MRGPGNGLTLIETLIVVAIIAIAARILVPMVGSASSMPVRSAADIEYAQSVAISEAQNFSVVSTTDVKLGHLGGPYGGGGGAVMKIAVEPVTGFVPIAN